MQDQRAVELLRRHESLKARRALWDNHWRAVGAVFFPSTNDFGIERSPGTQRQSAVFDSYPQQALYGFSAALEAGLTPANARWFKPSTGDEELDEQPVVAEYLDTLGQRLWKRIYRTKSNFGGQLNEIFMGLGSYGTACLFIENDGEGRPVFKAIPLSEIYIATSSEGLVDTVHREFTLENRQAVQMFGDDTPKETMDRVEKHPFESRVYVHCVAPRADYDETKLGSSRLKFASFYLCVSSKQIIRESGFYEMPYAAPRYTIAPSEIYGRSPAIVHLPDARMLQRMMWTTISGAHMAVDPALLVHDDAELPEVGMQPGYRVYGGIDDNGRALVQALKSGDRPEIGLDMIQRIRDQIDESMLGLVFRTLRDNPQMTATQALLLSQQQGQRISPVIQRLQRELLEPVIKRSAGMLFRSGEMAPPPAELRDALRARGEPLTIHYESPIVNAANADRGIAIMRTFEQLTPLAQQDPTVFDAFDLPKMAKELAKVNGVPPGLLRSQEDVEAKAQERSNMQAAQLAIEAAPAAANSAKTLAEVQSLAQSSPRPTPPNIPLTRGV